MAPAARNLEWAGAVILIAGCLAILGTFLPWIQATAGLVGTISRNGLDGGGDGIITIAMGIVIGLTGIAVIANSGNPTTARIGALIASGVLGWIAYIDIADVNHRIAGLDSNVVGTLGSGLILVAFAAVLGVIGAFMPSTNRVADAAARTTAMAAASGTGAWGPQSQAGENMKCGNCDKPLSPVWKGKCEHCKAPYATYAPVPRPQ